MTLYNDLVNEYSQEIQVIKDLEAQIEKLDSELSEYMNSMSPYDKEFNYPSEKVQALSALQAHCADLRNQLANNIDMEYHHVPFAKIAKQGITRFYELAGI